MLPDLIRPRPRVCLSKPEGTLGLSGPSRTSSTGLQPCPYGRWIALNTGSRSRTAGTPSRGSRFAGVENRILRRVCSSRGLGWGLPVSLRGSLRQPDGPLAGGESVPRPARNACGSDFSPDALTPLKVATGRHARRPARVNADAEPSPTATRSAGLQPCPDRRWACVRRPAAHPVATPSNRRQWTAARIRRLRDALESRRWRLKQAGG